MSCKLVSKHVGKGETYHRGQLPNGGGGGGGASLPGIELCPANTVLPAWTQTDGYKKNRPQSHFPPRAMQFLIHDKQFQTGIS